MTTLEIPLATVALAVEIAPHRTLCAVARLPGVGDLATRECWRCDDPELRMRAEEMPVAFRSNDVMDSLILYDLLDRDGAAGATGHPLRRNRDAR